MEAPVINTSRSLWQLTETIHSVVYFAPQARAMYEAAGLKGYWMGYFASRAAALGPVPASVVEATFFNFHPKMVRRAIPDAWSMSSPERVLSARYAIVTSVLSTAWADIDIEHIGRVSDDLGKVVAACPANGRPLFAAHAALEVPSIAHLRVWHACTALREFRGDTHVAALVMSGLDGIEAHVTAVAAGSSSRDAIEPNRGWSDEEWAAAETRLRERGLLNIDGSLTPRGRETRDEIERVTDEVSMRPWSALGPGGPERVARLLGAPVRAILAAGIIPFPNPMGLPQPG